jgi:hypothetical protein
MRLSEYLYKKNHIYKKILIFKSLLLDNKNISLLQKILRFQASEICEIQLI